MTREDCVRSVNTALSNYGLDFKINVGQVKRWLESATCTKSTEVVSAQDWSVDARKMHGKPILPNYMYFQAMKTTNHSLEMSRKANMKERHHLPLVDRGLVLYEICILPATRMGYAKTDLSKTPHGSERTRNQISIEKVLRNCNIPCITVNHGGANGLVDLAASLSLVVVYKKNNAINSI